MPGNARVDFLQAGTRVGQSWIAEHTLSRYSLGRICIEEQDRYPDIEIWQSVLLKRGLTVELYRYGERVAKAGTIGRLCFYYRKQ